MCDDSHEKAELEMYKNLYRSAIKELTNLRNLLWYMRPGDLEKLIENRKYQETMRVKLGIIKQLVTQQSEENLPPQKPCPDFEFPKPEEFVNDPLILKTKQELLDTEKQS